VYANPSTRIEMCPRLKKSRMKTVETRTALGRFLINKKLITTRRNVTPIEKRKGRMTTFASTSRKFQVNSARLGYIARRIKKRGYFLMLLQAASKRKKARPQSRAAR
jgi:hypothetical protein